MVLIIEGYVFTSLGAQLMLLQATFISPVAGTIYMRQVERENVEIFGKLYWVDDRPSTLQHNWHIHEEQVSRDLFNGNTCR